MCKPGELFSSPLFPGLAIDPAWIEKYPKEVKLVTQFDPRVIVSPSTIDPKLTRKAYALATRIAQHFGNNGMR